MAANVGILPWSAGSGTTAPRLFTASELTLAQRVDAVSMLRFNTPGGTLAPYYARHGDGGLLAATDLIPAAGSWMPYLYSTNPHPDVVAGQDGNFKLVADNASKGGLLSAAVYTSNKIVRAGGSTIHNGFIYSDISQRTEIRVERDSEEIKTLREQKTHLELRVEEAIESAISKFVLQIIMLE